VRFGAVVFFAAVVVRRVVVRFRVVDPLPSSLCVAAPREPRNALLERVEAAELLLHRVDVLRHRRRPVHQRLRSGQFRDPADHLLAAIGEPAEDVLFCLSHR
jgi:hypothetical protein